MHGYGYCYIVYNYGTLEDDRNSLLVTKLFTAQSNVLNKSVGKCLGTS